MSDSDELSTLRRCHALLLDFGDIRGAATFGACMIDQGTVRRTPNKRCSRQGLGLLGALWLKRLQDAGLARQFQENRSLIWTAVLP